MSTLVSNRKAFFHYEMLQAYEAGLVLKGGEVKAIRASQANLTDAYGFVENGELFLRGIHVKRWSQDTSRTHEENRPKKALLKRQQIRQLQRALEQKGLTLVVTQLYLHPRGWIKASLHLAKGKKKYDKRLTKKKRELEREAQKALKLRHKR